MAVDLEGRDEAVRPSVRADVESVAALPETERRAALVDTGLLMPHWPVPYGRAADAVTQVVIDEELARAGVVRPDIVIAGWALPTILQHGTDAQRERMRAAYRMAGPVAVAGFRQVLEAMMDEESRRHYEALAGKGG